MPARKLFILVGVVALGLAGCVSQKQPPRSTPQYVDDHAYALLFDLLGDEKDVSKLLIVKHARPDLMVLVKEISRVAKEEHERLEAFGKADPNLDLKNPGLPVGEVETRKAIAKSKSKELLTEKGKAFEIRLLLSQSEALTYGAHLAQVIAAREINVERAESVRKSGNELNELQRRVFEMLLEHYQ
jgi:hypothetical protein